MVRIGINSLENRRFKTRNGWQKSYGSKYADNSTVDDLLVQSWWRIYEPNNYRNNERCSVVWSDKRLVDIDCSLDYRFVCEWDFRFEMASRGKQPAMSVDDSNCQATVICQSKSCCLQKLDI